MKFLKKYYFLYKKRFLKWFLNLIFIFIFIIGLNAKWQKFVGRR